MTEVCRKHGWERPVGAPSLMCPECLADRLANTTPLTFGADNESQTRCARCNGFETQNARLRAALDLSETRIRNMEAHIATLERERAGNDIRADAAEQVCDEAVAEVEAVRSALSALIAASDEEDAEAFVASVKHARALLEEK